MTKNIIISTVFVNLGQAPFNCSYKLGDGIGGTEQYIGTKESSMKCAQECIRRKKTDESINGATFSTTDLKTCYCEKGMTRRNDNRDYMSCVLPVLRK